MQEFSATQLQQFLQDTSNTPLLLDVREEWEYERCHLEGSLLIPMRDIPNQLDELDPLQTIVVICHHGIRSRHIGIWLEREGYDNIINLSGGVDAWAREVDPAMEIY